MGLWCRQCYGAGSAELWGRRCYGAGDAMGQGVLCYGAGDAMGLTMLWGRRCYGAVGQVMLWGCGAGNAMGQGVLCYGAGDAMGLWGRQCYGAGSAVLWGRRCYGAVGRDVGQLLTFPPPPPPFPPHSPGGRPGARPTPAVGHRGGSAPRPPVGPHSAAAFGGPPRSAAAPSAPQLHLQLPPYGGGIRPTDGAARGGQRWVWGGGYGGRYGVGFEGTTMSIGCPTAPLGCPIDLH